MAIITISRQFGAGGETLGKMIAEKLGYTFANQNVIQMIAKEANVSENMVKLVETERGTALSKMISKIVSMRHIDRILKSEQGYIDEKIYLDYLVLVVAQVAAEGNVVIIGRGSQYILRDDPDAYHFLLIDKTENRIKFIMKHYNMSKSQATRVVNNEDKRRINLYKKLGKKDFDHPSLYHLALNMSRFSLESAMELICSFIK
jgi:cytidylate kinase